MLFEQRLDLRRRAIPTVFTDPSRIIDLSAVEDCHIVIAAVVVPLQIKLLKLQLDYLVTDT